MPLPWKRNFRWDLICHLLNVSTYTGILKKFYQATSLTELQLLYLGYDQHVWTLSKRFLLVSI